MAFFNMFCYTGLALRFCCSVAVHVVVPVVLVLRVRDGVTVVLGREGVRGGRLLSVCEGGEA